MKKDKYNKIIQDITSEIEKMGGIPDLYYNRGYYYFLSGNDSMAKEDYIKAVSYGLDFTEYPYYTFSNSNEKEENIYYQKKF